MSLIYYDKALYDKIHDLFNNVVNADEYSALTEGSNLPEVPTKENSSDIKSKLTFPLISFWRVSNPPNLDTDGNYPQILKGHRHDFDKSNYRAYRTFPVSITYQVSIWSDTRREVDEIYREFCMLFFVDEPYLKINIDNVKFVDEEGEDQVFNLSEEFSLQLVDSSTEIDTSSFSDKGRIYRQDIMIEIPNAKMFYFGKNLSKVLHASLSLEVVNRF